MMTNRYGKAAWLRLLPVGMEYSIKDDKIRIVAKRCRFRYFDLARIISCEYYTGHGHWRIPTPQENRVSL